MFKLFLGKYGKFVGIAAIVISGLAIKSHYIEVGYERATAAIQAKANAEIAAATKSAIEDAQEQVTRTLRLQQQYFEEERQRVKSDLIAETKIIEVIKNVDKIKLKNDCSDLGSDVVRLLNQSISAVNESH